MKRTKKKKTKLLRERRKFHHPPLLTRNAKRAAQRLLPATLKPAIRKVHPIHAKRAHLPRRCSICLSSLVPSTTISRVCGCLRFVCRVGGSRVVRRIFSRSGRRRHPPSDQPRVQGQTIIAWRRVSGCLSVTALSRPVLVVKGGGVFCLGSRPEKICSVGRF